MVGKSIECISVAHRQRLLGNLWCSDDIIQIRVAVSDKKRGREPGRLLYPAMWQGKPEG